MSLFFKDMNRQGPALVYIDDILLISISNSHMPKHIQQLHDNATNQSSKVVPENFFFRPLIVICLRRVNGFNTIKTF